MRQLHALATATRDRIRSRARGDRGEVPVWVVMTGLSVLLAMAVFAVLQQGLLDAARDVITNIGTGVNG